MTSDRDSLLESILERTRENGGRVTSKRIRIIEALIDLEQPALAEQIRLKAGLGPTDIVTVYRNLEQLSAIGVLQRVPLENGTQLFELTAPDEHYHHLICRKCHQTQRLDICMNEELTGIAQAHGFSDINHVMEIYGVCEQCDGAQ